jgi:hypothetical protein
MSILGAIVRCGRALLVGSGSTVSRGVGFASDGRALSWMMPWRVAAPCDAREPRSNDRRHLAPDRRRATLA